MDRYSVYCDDCEDDVFLLPIHYRGTKSIDYFLDEKAHTFDWEDGVKDHEYVKDMYALYRGAKLAGFIPDPEFPKLSEERWKDL